MSSNDTFVVDPNADGLFIAFVVSFTLLIAAVLVIATTTASVVPRFRQCGGGAVGKGKVGVPTVVASYGKVVRSLPVSCDAASGDTCGALLVAHDRAFAFALDDSLLYECDVALAGTCCDVRGNYCWSWRPELVDGVSETAGVLTVGFRNGRVWSPLRSWTLDESETLGAYTCALIASSSVLCRIDLARNVFVLQRQDTPDAFASSSRSKTVVRAPFGHRLLRMCGTPEGALVVSAEQDTEELYLWQYRGREMERIFGTSIASAQDSLVTRMAGIDGRACIQRGGNVEVYAIIPESPHKFTRIQSVFGNKMGLSLDANALCVVTGDGKSTVMPWNEERTQYSAAAGPDEAARVAQEALFPYGSTLLCSTAILN